MGFIPKFQIPNETSPVNKILTISNNINAETNSTLNGDLTESQQNDKIGNGPLRTANNKHDWGSVGVILNMLLKNPPDFEYQGKPSGIREKKLFILNATKISIKSGIVDDNGEY